MPTQPNDNLIVRKIDNPNLGNILNDLSSLIDEVVNYSSNIFAYVINIPFAGTHHIVAFSLFRRFIELLDSISILIKNSCISPAKILLRSLFEILLFFEYLIEDRNLYELRAYDYLFFLKKKDIYLYRRFIKGDPLYNEYIKKFDNDNLLKKPIMPTSKSDINRIREIVRKKQKILNNNIYYQRSLNSYKDYEISKKRKPKWWFNLHDGPNDIYDLAKKMRREAQYEILYKNFSGYVHGISDIEEHIEIENSQVSFPQIRLPRDVQLVVNLSVSFGLCFLKNIIDFYAKEKLIEFCQWYKREIKDKYININKIKIQIK